VPLASLIVAAAVAAPAGEGARDAVRGFYTLVDRRPAAACRTYLTPRARRQWNSFDSLPCNRERATVDSSDRREYFVVSRPGPRVARVGVRLVDLRPCGDLGHRYVQTVVFRGGRWRIARFGALECLDER